MVDGRSSDVKAMNSTEVDKEMASIRWVKEGKTNTEIPDGCSLGAIRFLFWKIYDFSYD